ncbi:hypothetical protein JI435_421550 [Parastagonospora nodorum SN15]|uniref:Uncharacterized protein n=1 Tax=Phaeosphaeria nodorum (strain SN15 / ATCC MYA-4574 / FGSC 10173) TaxID=321614 RepID=A0A7U2I8A4_PHANO|nr:hypothetical protein JI435_421550 [Parastagonospora nodorum SN15]
MGRGRGYVRRGCKWVVCGVLEGVFRRMPKGPRREDGEREALQKVCWGWWMGETMEGGDV